MIRESFKEFLKTANGNPIVGVEVGVFMGENAKNMLENCPNLNLILVDPYLANDVNLTTVNLEKYSIEGADDLMHNMLDRLSEFNGKFELMREHSASAALKIKNGYLDYVYIDGAHDYDNVIVDLMMWYPKVKEGGMLAGHDYIHKPVAEAVGDWTRNKRIKLYVEGFDWWVIKDERY